MFKFLTLPGKGYQFGTSCTFGESEKKVLDREEYAQCLGSKTARSKG
jgi:hypothetical protein